MNITIKGFFEFFRHLRIKGFFFGIFLNLDLIKKIIF
jgi:hypothetical protein